MAQPGDGSGTGDPFDPFGQWKQMRQTSVDAWSKMMIDFVNSEEYSRASAEWLDTYLTMSQSFQKAIEQTWARSMTQYQMPTTGDIVRLAERLTNIELRLDDLDAGIAEVRGALAGLSPVAAPSEPIEARLDAVDARLAELQHLLTTLSAPTAATEAATGPKTRARGEPRPAGSDPARSANGEASADTHERKG